MHQEADMKSEIQKPNPADVAHCILYVINPSTTNFEDISECMASMVEFIKGKNSEGNLRLLNNDYVYMYISVHHLYVNISSFKDLLLSYFHSGFEISKNMFTKLNT